MKLNKALLLAILLTGCATEDKQLYRLYQFPKYEAYAKKITIKRALPADSRAMFPHDVPTVKVTGSTKKAVERHTATQAAIAQAIGTYKVTVAWDRNPEIDIAGYRVYHSGKNGIGPVMVDVGNVVTATLQVPSPRLFNVTAYNTSALESEKSKTVLFTKTPTKLSLTKVGVVELNIEGETGLIYDVYQSDDLLKWDLLGTVQNETGTVILMDETSGSVSQRFYRVTTRF